MKELNLGKSGLMVPEIALGRMRIASLEEKALEELLETAIECGVRFFDHADIYGNGACEEVFGQILAKRRELREEILLQSKCGICREPKGYDFSKEHILESVDASLRRLHTEYLDLLVLHRPDALMEPEEVAEAFDELEAAGKVRHFGVSNFSSRQLELLQSGIKQKLLVNQMQFGIMHSGLVDHALYANSGFQQAADQDGELLDYCRLRGVTIQTWSPFQYGFFEGIFIDNEKFPELNEALERIGRKYGISKSALAVAWILRHPAQMQVIVGTTNAGRLRDICTASGVKISRGDWYEIYQAAGKKVL